METIVTNHARRKLKERAGVGKNNAHEMAYRARFYGLGLKDCEGELAKWLFCKRLKCGAFAKIYGKKTYIFSEDGILITIYPLPKEFEDLEKHVKPEAWKRYKRYTNSLHRAQNVPIKTTDKPQLKDPNTIKVVLNRHLEAENIDFLVIKVVRVGNSYMAYFVSDEPRRDSRFFKSLCDWARNSLKIRVFFEHRKDEEGNYVLKKDWLSGNVRKE